VADRIEELMDANLRRVFGERDPERRRVAIEDTYTRDVVFSDPEETVSGWDAVHRKAQGLLDGAPGSAFSADGPVRRAQDLALLAWQFGPPGQEPVVRGIDVAEVRDDRIARLWTMLVQD